MSIIPWCVIKKHQLIVERFNGTMEGTHGPLWILPAKYQWPLVETQVGIQWPVPACTYRKPFQGGTSIEIRWYGIECNLDFENFEINVDPVHKRSNAYVIIHLWLKIWCHRLLSVILLCFKQTVNTLYYTEMSIPSNMLWNVNNSLHQDKSIREDGSFKGHCLTQHDFCSIFSSST